MEPRTSVLKHVVGSRPWRGKTRAFTESKRRPSRSEVDQALQDALRVKEKFLQIVSHELRTPLNIIMGYPGMILNNIFGETTPPIREGMKKVMKAAKHLLTMIDNILDLSQLEGNLLKARREPVDLAALLDENAEPALTLLEASPRFERDTAPSPSLTPQAAQAVGLTARHEAKLPARTIVWAWRRRGYRRNLRQRYRHRHRRKDR